MFIDFLSNNFRVYFSFLLIIDFDRIVKGIYLMILLSICLFFFFLSLYKVIDGYRPIRFIHISPLNLDKTRWQEIYKYINIYLYPVD